MSSGLDPLSTPSTAEPSLSTASAGAGVMSHGISQTQTTAEPEKDIFIAAQSGDIATIQQLLESGRARATDRDAQNITPLHWASINAQVPACRLLLEHGADVDALGGDLVATPMQWAARNGYLYVIHLLISHGADPSVQDSQGYNTLHLVTHSSAVMPLLYLLHQPINVDSRDSQGHTSLMWAAYQGDALSVDLLLKHGASTSTADDAGLTPLHWAVVRGNRMCIRRLVENGADINARDNDNRTARDMAVELKALGPYKRALEEGGMNEDGTKIKKPLSERHTKIAIFTLPSIFFFLIFKTVEILPWYTGIILAMAEFFGMHHIVSRVLLNNRSYTDNVTQSPYFSGIIFGSMLWVGYSWITRLLHSSESHPFVHLLFALAFGLSNYNYFRAVTLDPGTCPKPSSDEELKTIIENLTTEGRLNGQTFCVQCMARKPLRSKHCRVCDKCVARHDHHCPWVWNCVGSGNHRQFVMFITTLVLGILLFDYLAFNFYSTLPPLDPAQISPSCIFPASVCQATAQDTFLFAVTAWATLQLSWTLLLVAAQHWQILRQMTTLEVSNLGRYGFMGGRGGTSLASQMGHRHGTHGEQGGDAGDAIAAQNAHSHKHGGRCGGMGSFLLSITGFDRFTRGRAADGLARAKDAPNPFDAGCIGNCRDFWSNGGELGVEYERLYDVPPEGLLEAKRRREQEEGEDGLGVGKRRRGFFMGFGRPRAGYEPVSQV